MKKRTSLRRWKARCRLGRKIPLYAVIDFELDRWFMFVSVEENAAYFEAVPR